jgi:predicted PurR-regulated permease PerM
VTGSVLAIVGYIVLTPVLTFYLLRDYDEITARIGSLLPESRKGGITQFAVEFDALLARYLRGQFTVGLLVGTITALGLWLSGFPHAFLLGVIVAVLGFIPYVGLVLSLIPALIIVISGAPGASLIKVIVVYAVAQALEGTVISPKIVGESVGLHPVWVVLALAVGGYLFGFVGLLIAVPLAVGVKLLVVRAVERYRDSGVYRSSPDPT